MAFDLLRIRPYLGALLMGCAVWVMIGSFDALWSVALDDLDTADWIATSASRCSPCRSIVFGAAGGRLAQRVGPFRVGAVGLLFGSAFMIPYGLVPSGLAMFVVAMVHSVNDGLTVSSTGVAAGMVVPPERQAGAQGLLGGAQTLLAGDHRARRRHGLRDVRTDHRLPRGRRADAGARRLGLAHRRSGPALARRAGGAGCYGACACACGSTVNRPAARSDNLIPCPR